MAADDDRRNEAATGGPGTIELGGTTYLVGQPTDQDFACLRARLREKLANPLLAIADDLKGLPPAVQQMAVREAVALKAGGGADLTEAFVREELLKPAAAAFLAWLLIRKHHPEVTAEAVRGHFTDANTADLLARLGGACGLTAADPGKAIGRPG